jgi:leucyl-tRNA synthetase
MICVNELTSLDCHAREVLEPLTVLLAPFAPHIAEELWEQLGHEGSIETVPFPIADESLIVEDTKVYPVSFNGKMRFTLELSVALDSDQIKAAVLVDSRTTEYLGTAAPKKWIIVPQKIINIVF